MIIYIFFNDDICRFMPSFNYCFFFNHLPRLVSLIFRIKSDIIEVFELQRDQIYVLNHS